MSTSFESDVLTAEGLEWRLFVTRNISFWQESIFNYGQAHYMSLFGLQTPVQFLFVTFNGTLTHLFTHGNNLKDLENEIAPLMRDPGFMRELRIEYREKAESFLEAAKKLQEDSNAENWEHFVEEYARYSPALPITTILGRLGTEWAVTRLRQLSVPEEEIQEIVGIISYPDEHTPLYQSRLDLLQIGAAMQSGAESAETIEHELDDWLDRHGHIPVNFCDAPWNLEDARMQLDDQLKKDCEEELEKAQANHEEHIRRRKEMLEKYRDEELTAISSALQETTYLNEFRKNVITRTALVARKVFQKLAKGHSDLTWSDFYYLLSSEIGDFINNEPVPVKELKEARETAGMLTQSDGQVVFLEPEVLSRFAQYLRSQRSESASAPVSRETFIKGFVASKGTVQGPVKVVLSAHEFGKVEAGDILVTTMTSVDFVPVMERAAAFITNEGGITSHAAIVAREMGKPCIIGTKHATAQLRDGDMVEVNGSTGIVTILS